MTKTLTSLISAVQVKLIDDGTRFSTATCTEAIREGLKEINIRVPVFAASLITIVTDQKEYEISDTDSRALSIIGVWLYDDTGKDNHIPLVYNQYLEDERLFILLDTPQDSDEQLLVRYSIPHTISGLDSETESTLSNLHDQILIGGAKAEAMQMRADSRIETINLQSAVSDNYREQITAIKAKFFSDLATLANNRYPAVGTQAAEAAWNDKYHNWEQ
jgi:hypothetical protein